MNKKLYRVVFRAYDPASKNPDTLLHVGSYFVYANSPKEAEKKAEFMLPERYEFPEEEIPNIIQEYTDTYYGIREGTIPPPIPYNLLARYTVQTLLDTLYHLKATNDDMPEIYRGIATAKDFLDKTG